MKELINSKRIEIRTKILAKQIEDKHRDDKTPIVMVCLLSGGFMFFSDLVRNIELNLECEFMRVKSYTGKKKQGDIQITKDLETSIKGKHVYIVDDIFDTGNTMKAVAQYLKVKKPRSINVIALVLRNENKWYPKQDDPLINTIETGFTIQDEWIVGYGMDNEQGFLRNYPYILEL